MIYIDDRNTFSHEAHALWKKNPVAKNDRVLLFRRKAKEVRDEIFTISVVYSFHGRSDW